jgi:hypothetical protein
MPTFRSTSPIFRQALTELYNSKTGSWHSAGSTTVQLWDSGLGCGEFNAPPPTPTFELGPAVLRADGTVFYTGSNSCPNGLGVTAIYNTKDRLWCPGPVFPSVDGVTDINIADGPASWEPNDKVLMMASPAFGSPPSFFFEWDGRNLKQVPGPPNAPSDGSFFGNMLLLPTGQILLTDFSGDIELYNPTITGKDREFQRDIAPVVLYTPLVLGRGDSYQIDGIGFNGVSQGAAYGDDVQAATNFPLVRIRDALLSVALSLEQSSEHPLAQAVRTFGSGHSVEPAVITDFVSITGEGVRGQLSGESVALGNKKLMEAAGIDLSAVAADADRLRDEGATVMFVSRGSTLLGLIAVADSVKVSTPTALQDAHSERSRTQARRTETRRRPALGRPSVGVHGLPVRASM